MDNTYWNDAGGKHPLSEFWLGRFLFDPVNQLSGPARSGQPDLRTVLTVVVLESRISPWRIGWNLDAIWG
jgi:hypothetical protein